MMKQKTRYKNWKCRYRLSVHEWPLYWYWPQKSHIDRSLARTSQFLAFNHPKLQINMPFIYSKSVEKEQGKCNCLWWDWNEWNFQLTQHILIRFHCWLDLNRLLPLHITVFHHLVFSFHMTTKLKVVLQGW